MTQEGKAKGGRPTDYTTDITARICERIAAGESIRSISADDDMPCMATMFVWLSKHKEFVEQYAIARQQQMETFSEEILDIADNSSNDWMERNDPENPGYRVNGEAIQRARLRVDTRKWLMSKLAPKKYGDKLDVHHGGQPENPILISPVELIAKRIETMSARKELPESANEGESSEV